jgi:WD40 repeat protein
VVGEQVVTWDTKTAEVQRTYRMPVPWVDKLVLSRDGKMAAGYYKKTATVWDARTGEKVHHLVHQDDLFSALFSPDGRHLLTGTGTFTNVPDGAYVNCRVMVWDVKTGKFVRQFEGLKRPARALAFSREGHVLAFSTFDMIRWDGDSGKVLAQHTVRGVGFEYPVFSPDARDALVPTTRSFAVWSTTDGAKVREFPDLPVHVRWLEVSRNGRWALSGCASVDTGVRLWSLTSGKLLTTLTGHTKHLRGVALSPDATAVVSWSDDNTIRVYGLIRDLGN